MHTGEAQVCVCVCHCVYLFVGSALLCCQLVKHAAVILIDLLHLVDVTRHLFHCSQRLWVDDSGSAAGHKTCLNTILWGLLPLRCVCGLPVRCMFGLPVRCVCSGLSASVRDTSSRSSSGYFRTLWTGLIRYDSREDECWLVGFLASRNCLKAASVLAASQVVRVKG